MDPEHAEYSHRKRQETMANHSSDQAIARHDPEARFWKILKWKEQISANDQTWHKDVLLILTKQKGSVGFPETKGTDTLEIKPVIFH